MMPQPKSLDRERAYRKLVDLILSGELSENTPLSERGLGESLELGRTPISEAINLVREGVLETHPTRGTFIRPLSLLDLQELYRIRYAIEGLAAFLAAERGPGEELISYAAAFQTGFDAPETFDIAEVHDHGVEFHFGVPRRRKSQAAGDVPPFPLFEAAPPEAFFSDPQNDRTKLLLNQILH